MLMGWLSRREKVYVMRKYELMFVLPGTFDDKESEAKSKEVVEVVKKFGSEVESHFLGKNRLAYPVKQIRYGYFYTAVFASEPASVKTLEEKLRLMRDVLRVMITHFNTNLTSIQKITYATDDAGMTTMRERNEEVTGVPAVSTKQKIESLIEEKVPASEEKVVSKAERKITETDLDAIAKRLDDIMKGDVIPGV